MKKKLFFKFFVFAVIGALVTMTSCKDYDDDISKLNTELSSLKSSVLGQADLTALKSQLESSISAVQNDLNTAKTRLQALEANGAPEVDTDAIKEEILKAAVKLETFTTFQEAVDGELATLKADLAKAATEEDVKALETLVNSEVAQLKLDLAASISNLDAIEEVVEGNSEAIADIYTKLEEQLEAIEANAGDIEALKEELEEMYEELSTEIESLKTNLATLTENLGILESKVDGIKAELDGKISALTGRVNSLEALMVDVFNKLDKRVTSLTFIPDYTSGDGTPQLPVHFLGEWYKPIPTVENWDPYLYGEDELLLTPYKGKTYAKFHVSPSNVTLNDFEVVGLLHKTSEILWRSADNEEPLLKAVVEEVTLKNGILTVPILVHADLYNRYDYRYGDNYGPGPVSLRATPDDDDELLFTPEWLWENNISIALEVKNTNGIDEDDTEERLVVSSEYINSHLSMLFARIELIDDEGRVGRWPNILPSHMADDIALDSYYKESASIELWNGYNRNTLQYDNGYGINLNDSLQAIARFNYAWRILEEHGYDNIEDHFVFELIDNPNEGVDQSNRYVELDGATGAIKVKPTSAGGANQSAVGRTPVVLAKVVLDDIVYAAGYLKIVITEEVNNDPVEFEFTLEDFVLNCEAEYELTDVDIDAIDFDQIFNHPRIMLGKDAFFNAYRANYDWQIRTEVISDPIAASGNEIDFSWNIIEPTQGGNLANYISATVTNTAPAGEYVIETTLRGRGNQPDVVITWTINVKLPEGITLTADPSFLSNGIFKVEPTVYRQTPTPKSSTPYEGLLHNAFMHNEQDFGFGILQDDQECDDFLTPYFVFTSVPEGFEIDGNYTVRRKSDNNIAAVIVERNGYWYIELNNQESGSTQVGNYQPLSPAAIALVKAGWVEVQPKAYINGQIANVIDLYDEFRVTFTYPLEFSFADNYEVWDQGTGDNNKVTLNISDGFPYQRDVLVKDFLGNNIVFGSTGINIDDRDLINHYEIANTQFVPHLLFDFDNITTSLPGGTLPSGVGAKVNEDDTNIADTIDGTDIYSTLVIEWSNETGGSVQEAFEMYIPVKLDHKWGTLESKVTITVNPGQGPN